MRLLIALLAAAPLLLAGCSGPAPHSPPAHDGYVTAPHAQNVDLTQPCLGYVGNADLIGVGAQAPSQEFRHFSLTDNGAEMGVPENVSAIILDLWWENGATTGIRSEAVGPAGAGATSPAQQVATREDPVRMRFDHPAAGTWTWHGLADPLAVGVVLHFNYGLYYETPESLAFVCNPARATPAG
ncbi:MAG: hypothetical protein V4510_03075 [bacterium]